MHYAQVDVHSIEGGTEVAVESPGGHRDVTSGLVREGSRGCQRNFSPNMRKALLEPEEPFRFSYLRSQGDLKALEIRPRNRMIPPKMKWIRLLPRATTNRRHNRFKTLRNVPIPPDYRGTLPPRCRAWTTLTATEFARTRTASRLRLSGSEGNNNRGSPLRKVARVAGRAFDVPIRI